MIGQHNGIGLLALVLIGSMSACQMPSPAGPSGSSSSSSGSAGGSTGGAMPGGGAAGGSSGGGAGSDAGAGGSQGGSAGTVGGTNSGSQPAGTISGGLPGSAGGADGSDLESLDESLDESLEEFDDAIADGGSAKGPDTIDILTRSGNRSQMDGPIFEEADISEADGPIEDDNIEQRAAEGAPPGSESAEQTASSGAGQDGIPGAAVPVPADIDDGRGDSIVLRQIRDAAMKEQDPVLREKLWDEYRRIKNQGKG